MSIEFKDEFIRRTARTGVLDVGLGLICVFQAASVGFAFREMIPAGIEGLVLPTAAALLIGIALFFTWRYLLHVGPFSEEHSKRVMYVMIGATLFAISVATTSWFTTATITGDRAVRAHMNAYIAEANKRTGVVTSNLESERPMVGILLKSAAARRLLAESEENLGLAGKGKGTGPVSDMYRRTASNLQQTANVVENTLDKGKAEASKAKAMVDEMARIANSPGAASTEGQTAFVEAAVKHIRALSELSTVTSLPQVDLVGVVEGGNASKVSTLDEETRALKDEAKRVKDAKVTLPIEKAYVPITKSAAVADYPGVAAGGWVMSVALDSLPFLILLLLMVAISEARKPDTAHRMTFAPRVVRHHQAAE